MVPGPPIVKDRIIIVKIIIYIYMYTFTYRELDFGPSASDILFSSIIYSQLLMREMRLRWVK